MEEQMQLRVLLLILTIADVFSLVIWLKNREKSVLLVTTILLLVTSANSHAAKSGVLTVFFGCVTFVFAILLIVGVRRRTT